MIILRVFVLLVFVVTVYAGEPVIKVTESWKNEIRELAPAESRVKPKTPRKILVCSLMTGYRHWVTTNTSVVIEIIGEKSGAFEVVESNDVMMFSPEKLKDFDAVILNNTCSKRDHRNLFLDALGEDRRDEVSKLENSLLKFVKDGKGLIVIHGGIVTFNGCDKIADMIGGAFDFHPPQQEVTVTAVDTKHPLVQAFKGKPFVHVDEPYIFKGAYKSRNFRPLMVMDTSKLECGKNREKVMSEIRYISWIKKYGKGRVFFVSPSHNAQSFSDPRLLQFYLDGIQYALGDFECDDSPMKK
jgi:type 1 glutamine amidotransferase